MMQISGWVKTWMVMLMACVFVVYPASVRGATPEQVETAIKKGVAYLYAEQNKANGSWETVPARAKGAQHETTAGQWGGLTAIATYALLASGENPQNPQVKKAIEFLKQADIVGLYALGMRSQVWALIPQDDSVREAARRDANLIAEATKTEGGSRGFYDYLKGGKGGRYDHSVSQYGVLGMWALSQSGLDIPISYWQAVDDAWKRDQGADGSWQYGPGKPANPEASTYSMTAAGVATLFITQDYLSIAQGAMTRGNITNPAIEAGMKWMSDHFARPKQHFLYTLYGIERIGVASGYKYFGKNNWYELGSEWIVKAQGPNGSWSGESGGPVPSTAFSLLFLTRGRAPVVMNKLEYSLEDKKAPRIGNWNQRPRDVANVTRWIGKQLERDLNWQIVNLTVPVDELHDSQILYIAGDQTLAFSDEDIAKLKQFVEQGGMIVGNSDGRSRNFTRGFQELGEKMFGGKFRQLPEDHPIYRQQFLRSKWRNKPSVLGLSNGARELMVIAPELDSARWWQIQLTGSHEESWELMSNIFLYSVDRQNLRVKGQTYIVRPDTKIKTAKTETVLRGEYDGNWNPEPGGWVRLDAVMHNAGLMDVKTKAVKLGKDALSGGKVLHLTGTEAVKFSPEQREAIKKFVESGGTLVVDAAGGRPEFAQSIEIELETIFGADAAKQLKTPLADDSPVYSAGGKKIDEVRYRSFARRTLVGNLRGPRLRGMKIGDRIAVFYSPEDLSVGLVGQPVDGIIGYEPESATDLMRNILLYVSK